MGSEVAVITGASAGVGRALAREFARHGARVGLIARDRSRLEKTKAEVEALGGEAFIAIADVADAAQVVQSLEAIERHFGPIDIWINNAMVSVFSPAADLTPEELARVTAVTYLGTAYGTIAALRRMRRRNRGKIVQVGSALAYRSIPLQAAYCAAKHAVVGFTASLRTELLREKSGISLTMVHLPAVNTPQFDWVKSRLPNKPQPVPPIFQPEVVARGIYWAAHQNRREILIGGSTLEAVWGNKLASNIADHYLARKGYSSQQTPEPDDPSRPNNLWQSVPGNYGAHGRFDGQAKSFSAQAWLDRNRRVILGALALLGGSLLVRNARRRAESVRRIARAA